MRFEESYSGSGAQARAIASGFDADVAILSLEGDIDKLVKAGLVREGLEGGPASRHDHPQPGRHRLPPRQPQTNTRLGRPDETRDRSRLSRPEDFGRGALEHQRDLRRRPLPRPAGRIPIAKRPATCSSRVQDNVITMDASGRQSMATFDRGTGDAIVTYENELLLQGKLEGRVPPYVIPPATLLIEGPAAVVDASVERHGNRELAEAFLDYLRSEEGQQHPRGLRLPAAGPGPRHQP